MEGGAVRTSQALGEAAEPLQPRIPGFDDSASLEDVQTFLEEQEEEKDREPGELERFGSKIFNQDITTFAPVDNIPVPEAYRLGVGDNLEVMLVGKEPSAPLANRFS